jgi:ferrochelatase
MDELRTGVVLINLGSPEAPTPGAVRRFLREFLGDPRVLDMPAPARWLLLNAVILPFRPRRSARAYREIWLPQGAPLLVHGQALRDGVAAALDSPYVVELAMRYGTPSIRSALQRLSAMDVARILILPLFPQYSAATTGSVLERVEAEIERRPEIPPIEVLPPFYAEPRFIAAWIELAQPELESFRPDFVLFSYHGLPERQLKAADPTGSHCLAHAGCCDAIEQINRDCYRAQCFATTRALVADLGLAPTHQHAVDRPAYGPAAAGARRRRPPAAGRPVPRLRRGLPRDPRGDRHPRPPALARARWRGASPRPLAQREPRLGRGPGAVGAHARLNLRPRV